MRDPVDELRDEIMRRVKAACGSIAEVADHVQILVTTQVPTTDETLACLWGSGNLHARRGVCREWLDMQQEQDRATVRSENQE